MNYEDSEYYTTIAGYIAVQVAIWCKMAGISPYSLPSASGIDETLASAVRNLAGELYDSSYVYSPYTAMKVSGTEVKTNGGSYDLGNLSSSKVLYYEGDQLYWRTPVISVVEYDGMELDTTIDVSDIPGAFVTGTSGTEVPMTDGKAVIGNTSSFGTAFYVYVPVESTNSTGTVNITASLDVLNVEFWDGGSSQNLAALAESNNTHSYSLTMS